LIHRRARDNLENRDILVAREKESKSHSIVVVSETQGKFPKIFSKVGYKVVPYARLDQFSQVPGILKN
jgi:hypothetical protein